MPHEPQPRNPCGLLRHIVETPASQAFITHADEEQARSWLKTLSHTTPASAPATVSIDAQFVLILRRKLENAGLHGDLYSYLRSSPQGQAEWPPERWNAAYLEALYKDLPR